MKVHIFFKATLTAVLFANLASCGSPLFPRNKSDSGDNGSSPKTNGSCVSKDGSHLSMCYEQVEYDEDFRAICEHAAGGQWSAQGCNLSGYARKCNETATQSTNGGPRREIHEVHYFMPGSTIKCSGTETKL